jgi:hypothetical protein
MKIFALIDHSGEAEKARKGGTPLMLAAPPSRWTFP